MNKYILIFIVSIIVIFSSCKTYVTIKPGRYINPDGSDWMPGNTNQALPMDVYIYSSKKGKYLQMVKIKKN